MKTKDLYFYLSAIVAVLILLAVGYIALNYNYSPYKYSVTKTIVIDASSKGTVDFVSNSEDPGTILDRIRASGNVIVSPEFVAQGPENAYATSAATLFSTVFIAKGKKVVLLARVVGENGKLVSCSSNFGDPKKNEPVPLEECRTMIADESSARVLVPLPDSALRKPIVVLEGSEAIVRSHTLQALPFASFALAEALYPDARQVIASVNSVLGGLK